MKSLAWLVMGTLALVSLNCGASEIPLNQAITVSGSAGQVINKEIPVKGRYHYTACFSPDSGGANLYGSSLHMPTAADNEEKSENIGLWDSGPLLRRNCITFQTSEEQTTYYITIQGVEDFTGKFWYVGTPLDNVPAGFEQALVKPFDPMNFTTPKYGPFGSPWGNALFDPFADPDHDGFLHSGGDFQAPAGTSVKAACDGRIVRNGMLDDLVPSGWGGYSILECQRTAPDGKVVTLTIAYDHIKPESALPVGTQVVAGQEIGKVYPMQVEGEIDHLHLTICVGKYAECEAVKQQPQRGSISYDKFPGLWINPDPNTNPGLYQGS